MMVKLDKNVCLLLMMFLCGTAALDDSCEGSQSESECDSKYGLEPRKTASRNQEEELRIVFVGKTGTGKSATINTIAGKRLFNSTASPSSVTTKCQFAQFEVEGRQLLVVDTPGIFDTNTPNIEAAKELSKVMIITSPGFHVFVIVIRVGRFTEEEHNSVQILATMFGPELYERAVIVLTGLDDLEADGISFESFIKSAGENLTTLFADCGHRVVPFNNRLPLNGNARMGQVRKLRNHRYSN